MRRDWEWNGQGCKGSRAQAKGKQVRTSIGSSLLLLGMTVGKGAACVLEFVPRAKRAVLERTPSWAERGRVRSVDLSSLCISLSPATCVLKFVRTWKKGLFPNKPPRGLSVAKFVRLNLGAPAFGSWFMVEWFMVGRPPRVLSCQCAFPPG